MEHKDVNTRKNGVAESGEAAAAHEGRGTSMQRIAQLEQTMEELQADLDHLRDKVDDVFG